MIRHRLLNDSITTASRHSTSGLYCFECQTSIFLPKVDRKHVEEAEKLGPEKGSPVFAAAMMAAYKEDVEMKKIITDFLVLHTSLGHRISPAMLLMTTRGGRS